MKVPHRGGAGARSRARSTGVTIAVKEKIAPRNLDYAHNQRSERCSRSVDSGRG